MKKFYTEKGSGNTVPVTVIEDVELQGTHYAIIASPGLTGTATLSMEDVDQEMVSHGLLIVDWDQLSEHEPPRPVPAKPAGRIGAVGKRLTALLGHRQ